MKLFLITSLILISSTINASEVCNANSALLTARYNMQTESKNEDRTGNIKIRHLNIWRRGKEIAYEYPDIQMTEIWNQVGNTNIRPVKYFDAHQRAIEYQVLSGQKKVQWLSKYQLISEGLKEQMTLVKTEGSGCEELQYYSLQKKGKNYRMTWSTAYQLPLFYEDKTAESTFTLSLINKLNDSNTINEFFKLRDAYQTTDYADIGDNESDPFLLGMINLGFIEHGASGFYNAKGQQIPAQNEHGQHQH
jgi:hypothetical protein